MNIINVLTTYYSDLSLLWLLIGIMAFVVLLFIAAPYGKHSIGISKLWGPIYNGRYAFFFQEMPGLYLPVLYYFFGKRSFTVTIFLSLWYIHYVTRIVIIPLFINKCNHKSSPLSICCMASSFQIINSFFMWYGMCFRDADRFSELSSKLISGDFVTLMTFTFGICLFFVGLATNIKSDLLLLNLRKPNDEGYYIPKGFLFEYVSCANYFCEILEWLGFAIATQLYPAALIFWLWTIFNLAPRAYQHHKWYLRKFKGEYPKERKALIPFVF